MEKIGLFDLIDKFSTVASGKNEFNKKQNTPSLGLEEKSGEAKFVDPKTPPPAYYLMNAKMLNFCNRHDEFAKNVKR